MPAKMARSAPSAAVRGAKVTAAVRAASPACQNAAKAQKFVVVRSSSGVTRPTPVACARQPAAPITPFRGAVRDPARRAGSCSSPVPPIQSY